MSTPLPTGITISFEQYGASGNGPDVIVVRRDGVEIGVYSVVGSPRAEMAAMRDMLQEVTAAARAELERSP